MTKQFDEDVMISGNYKVGIGTTTSPSTKLHVVGPGTPSLVLNPTSPTALIENAGSAKIQFTDTKQNQVWQVGTANQGYGISEVSSTTGPIHQQTVLDHLVIQKGTGNVGIGTGKPEFKLDVADRIRLRQGSSHGAGIFFYQNTPGKDQAFVGMGKDNQVGFWGNTGCAWGLVMDTTTGNVGVGTETPRARLDVPSGGIVGSLAIGVKPPGNTINPPCPYETVSTTGNDHNLRLHSNQGIYLHAANSKNAQAIVDNAGNFWLGGTAGAGGKIGLSGKDVSQRFYRSDNTCTITLDGQAGDIILGNADCAEDFHVLEMQTTEPGTVMVIDAGGSLRQSTEAYDKKVAGVISGAGDFKPGMVLDRQPEQNSRMPVALMGKVYCKVDAQYAPIEVGDLLTTSPTSGHAMKAADPLKAFGAVLGKALCPLKERTGLIPILIALQ